DGIRDFHVTGVQTCALPILDGRENVALRGYEDNGLNQKDEYYNPIGGTVYNKFSLELRYPISLKAQMSAYVLGFYDAGAVYQDFKSYNPFKLDRKSTRLNSSHVKISYAVFCLKKKK